LQREPRYRLPGISVDRAEQRTEGSRLDDRRIMAFARGRQNLCSLEPRNGVVANEALGHSKAPKLVGESERAMRCFATVRAFDALGSFLKHWRVDGTDRRAPTKFVDQVAKASVVTNGRFAGEVLGLNPIFLPALGGSLELISGRRYPYWMRARCASQLCGNCGDRRGITVLEPRAELRRPRPGIIEADLCLTAQRKMLFLAVPAEPHAPE